MSCTESSERIWGISLCGSELDVVRSIPAEYFIKYSPSKRTHVGAADSNQNWGLCHHHGYMYIWFIWCFGGYSYPYEESQSENLSRGELHRLMCFNISRRWETWECPGLQYWAHRAHNSYLWVYFWIQIPYLGYSEVQGGYVIYQEILYVWNGFHIIKGAHHLSVHCKIGYAWIPWSGLFK